MPPATHQDPQTSAVSSIDDWSPEPEELELALTVLYQPLLARVGARALLGKPAPGHKVLLSSMEPGFSLPGKAAEPLGDEHLSRQPIVILADSTGGARLLLYGSTTAVAVRGRPVQQEVRFSDSELRRGVVLELGQRVVLLLHLVSPRLDTHTQPPALDPSQELLGDSDGLRRALRDVRSVADLELPVLLRGESGTGKELLARALHRGSPRRDRPFVAINLGAVTPSLAIAELFGVERWAFTGAERRQPGFFEQARSGTLFLDEIGEAPGEVQAALLRVLETGEVQTVGAQQARKADVRIIAATDANLESRVASGTFRAPLLNRLSAYEIWMPPLRERRDDIGRLLVRFLREELARVGELDRLKPPAPDGRLWLSASLVARLCDHDWPGNVRQLRNVVRQLVISSRGMDRVMLGPVVARMLAAQTSEAPGAAAAPPARQAAAPLRDVAPVAPARHEGPTIPAPRRRPAQISESELGEALRGCRWDLSAAAHRLGVSRPSLYVLMNRYPRFRTASTLGTEEIATCYAACAGNVGTMAERLEVSERALLRRIRKLRLGPQGRQGPEEERTR